MKTVKAELNVEVNVKCPNCEDTVINILDESTTNYRNHDEESYVLKQCFGEGTWIDLHEKFHVKNVTCTECKQTFNIYGLK